MFHTLNPEVLVGVINARVYSVKNTGPIVSPTVNLSSIDNLLSSLVEQFVPQVNNSESLESNTVIKQLEGELMLKTRLDFWLKYYITTENMDNTCLNLFNSAGSKINHFINKDISIISSTIGNHSNYAPLWGQCRYSHINTYINLMQYNCYLIYFVPMLVPLFNKLIGLGNLIHNIGYLLHRIISNCILYLLYPFERFFLFI